MPFGSRPSKWLADSQAARAAPVKCQMCDCAFFSAADGRGGTVFTDRVELADHKSEWHGFCHACLQKILKAIDKGELEANFVEAVRNFGSPAKRASFDPHLQGSTAAMSRSQRQGIQSLKPTLPNYLTP